MVDNTVTYPPPPPSSAHVPLGSGVISLVNRVFKIFSPVSESNPLLIYHK
ncbi:hypothetical protein A2U01_0099325, partial [Trifolium medium]|nr:hypothetical protein [Trifolium medium]